MTDFHAETYAVTPTHHNEKNDLPLPFNNTRKKQDFVSLLFLFLLSCLGQFYIIVKE